jgi:hypothetical protein
MKKLNFLLLILMIASSCAGESKKNQSETIEKNSFKDLNNQNIKKGKGEEYYTFKDGRKLAKSDWLNKFTIEYFVNSLHDSDFSIGVADCFMSEVSKKYNFEDIKPLMGSGGSDEELIKLNRVFYQLNLNSVMIACSRKLIDDYNLDKKFIIQSERQNLIFKDQIKIEFEKSPEFKEILNHLDEDKFYTCLTNSIIKNFSIKEILSGSAYSSKKYEDILEQCLISSKK